MGNHWLVVMRSEDVVGVILEIDAHVAEVRIVERVEGVESLSIDLDGAVASDQLTVEENAHLRHHWPSVLVLCRCNLDGSHQILLAVGTQFTDRQLATGQDYRFGQVLKHEAQGRRGVCHRIRAVQDHESVVVIIVVGYHAHDFCPSHRIHVAGVDRWVEFSHVDFCLDEFELGHGRDEMVEVERFQHACHRVFSHADGTSCINDENLWCCHFLCFFTFCHFVGCKDTENNC